jgi:hypothetical protein
LYLLLVGKLTKVSAAPLAGRVEPSRSAGKIAPAELPIGPTGLTKVAAAPVSIFARSKAKGCGPRKLVPLELKTFMLM